MRARDLIDSERSRHVESEDATTRAITYIRNRDNLNINLNAFVSDVEFNQDMKKDDKVVSRITCRALKLDEKPSKLDRLVYDNDTYYVRTWLKLGELYTVDAELHKRNKVASRTFR